MLDVTKKDKIMDAGLEEFAEYGYSMASTDRISDRAGVSKGLIFHYFGSKSKLYMILVNDCIDKMLDKYENIDIDNKDFISIIRELTKIKYEFFIDNPLRYKLIINGFNNTPKELGRELNQKYEKITQIGIDIFTHIIKSLPLKKDVSVESAVTIILGIQNVIQNKYLYHFTDAPYSFEKYFNDAADEFIELINIVLYGIIDGK